MEKVHLNFYKYRNNIINDAYDRMISGIYLAHKKNNYKSFSISGCEPSVGTTTIAISLAVAMATAGWKTVLVDADMKKWAKEKKHSSSIELGFSDYLANQITTEQLFHETNIENLTYVPCGSISNKSIELLCSKNCNDFIESVHKQYDFAIFDTPALNICIDGMFLAGKVSASIIIAEFNKTKMKQINTAKRELQRSGANILGLIINKADRYDYKRYLNNFEYLKSGKHREKRIID